MTPEINARQSRIADVIWLFKKTVTTFQKNRHEKSWQTDVQSHIMQIALVAELQLNTVFTVDWKDGWKPDNACGMLRENTAASESAPNCRRRSSVKDSFDFEFQSRLHWCETNLHKGGESTLLPSRCALMCRLFLLPKSRLQLNDRPNGIWFCDDFPPWGMSKTTLRWDSGAVIEKQHSGKAVHIYHCKRGRKWQLYIHQIKCLQ